jgi:hypothetical protein
MKEGRCRKEDKGRKIKKGRYDEGRYDERRMVATFAILAATAARDFVDGLDFEIHP